MNAELLTVFKRDGIIEREHFGYTVLTDLEGKILDKKGDCNGRYFLMRSCEKPFQALPLLISGAFKSFDMTLKELAVCCGSHTGTNEHIDLVKGILAKIGMVEENLLCPPCEPIDMQARTFLIKENLQPSRLHNNCSGKHAGMLTVCIHNNWDFSDYISPNHPLQKMILELVEEFCAVKNPPLSFDNCGTPVHAMLLHEMCKGYLNLFLSKEGLLLKEAFIKYPYIIGGNCRIESKIMSSSNKNLIAKNGAEGLCIVVNIEKQSALGVKVLDGNYEARSQVLLERLQKFGWIKNLS